MCYCVNNECGLGILIKCYDTTITNKMLKSAQIKKKEETKSKQSANCHHKQSKSMVNDSALHNLNDKRDKNDVAAKPIKTPSIPQIMILFENRFC